MAESAREVSQAVDGVVRTARAAGQSAHETTSLPDAEVHEVAMAVGDVEDAATEVRNTLDRLNAHLLRGSARVRICLKTCTILGFEWDFISLKSKPIL